MSQNCANIMVNGQGRLHLNFGIPFDPATGQDGG